MNRVNVIAFCYELGWKGESNIPLTTAESQEIKQILLSKDNFTYTELDNLDAETVELIYDVINSYSKGQDFKAKNEKKNYEPSRT